MFKKVLFTLFLFSSLPVMAMDPAEDPEVAAARARLAALRLAQEHQLKEEAERAAREAARAAEEELMVRSSIGPRHSDFDANNPNWD